MARRLLIDDARRFSDICHCEANDTEVVARNYVDGIKLLETNTWDELYLDHDLGDTSLDGYAVMSWLEEHPDRLPPKVVFVSANPVGVERMKQVLEAIQFSQKKLQPVFGCNNPKCGASSTIAEEMSFGSGKLDDYGFWEHPCDACAREWEKVHPGTTAWPTAKKETK